MGLPLHSLKYFLEICFKTQLSIDVYGLKQLKKLIHEQFGSIFNLGP